MENTFFEQRPRKICDEAILRFSSQYRRLQHRNIAISQHHWSVAYDNHPLMCFLRNVICDMRHRILAV